nr:uncharacterized protein LOC109178838 [Ipomoea batatas]GMD08593.1 uncharacterized protein LOC109178838 [Ipomoea batatas]GMD10001.1 uncharacterized protein LOC109178838 [Ipomoea batatas]
MVGNNNHFNLKGPTIQTHQGITPVFLGVIRWGLQIPKTLAIEDHHRDSKGSKILEVANNNNPCQIKDSKPRILNQGNLQKIHLHQIGKP